MRRPVPLKGHPDFSNLDNVRVKEFKEVINQMIVSYQDFPDKVSVLKEIWSDLKDEYTDRIALTPEKKVVKNDCERIRKAFLKKHKIRT